MKKSQWIGILLVSVLLIFAFVGLVWTPYNPDAMNIQLKNASPTLLHPFGNDNFGRDVFSRVMKGLSTTVVISTSVVAIGAVFGTLIGAVTGYAGGLVDDIVMRINDAVTAFPSILLALVFVSIFGSGKYHIILALGILFIPSFARVMRSEFIKQRQLDYVKNAKILGAGSCSILFRHMLPNMLATLIPTITIGFNNAVLAEAGMSFLGLGVQPPEASLGRMISEASGYLKIAPWTAIFPGIIMVVLVYSFSLIGGDAD